MMKYLIPLAALALVGCNETDEDRAADRERTIERGKDAAEAKVDTKAVLIGETAVPCFLTNDINVRSSSTELKGNLRQKFLTPEAQEAGVRVWVSSTSVTDYGNTVIRYTDPADDCILWAESLSLQEYSSKLGMNPLTITTGYEPAKPGT